MSTATPGAPAKPPGPRLAHLICSQCHAPVPLGTGPKDMARCLCCDNQVPVPAEYLAMRDAARADDANRARARELAARLAAPPGFWMRLWMQASDVAMLLAILVVVVWLLIGAIMCIGALFREGIAVFMLALIVGMLFSVPLVYNQILHDLARLLHADCADVLGDAVCYALLGLFFYVVLAVPMILGAYAESFETVRATLRKILAAKSPRTSGGPSECRLCGAALEVVPSAISAHCLYCRADNLVAIPDTLVRMAKAHSASEHYSIETAFAAERVARRAGIRLLLQRIAGWSALVPIFLVLGRLVAAINSDSSNFWHGIHTNSSMRPHSAENPVFLRGRSAPFTVRTTFDKCNTECRAYYYIPLRYRERPAITITGQGLRLAGIQARALGPWYNPNYDWADIDLKDGAPYTGWYRVILAAPRKISSALPTVHWDAVR